MGYLVQKPCKICGKMYTPCGYCEKDKTAFHWRTVACSKECGKEYLRRVANARNSKIITSEKKIKEENITIKDSSMDSVESEKDISKYKKKNSKKSEQID